MANLHEIPESIQKYNDEVAMCRTQIKSEEERRCEDCVIIVGVKDD